MSIEEQCYIDDHCSPLNADFTINKDYDKERRFWMKKWEEENNEKTRNNRVYRKDR